MQYVRPAVATTCVGQAASPSALLLAGGAPGRRAILAHGRVVLHQPSAEGRGTLPDLIVAADEIGRVRRQLEEVLSRHTGKDARRCAGTPTGTWSSPAEAAVAYGVADHVLRDRGPRTAARR